MFRDTFLHYHRLSTALVRSGDAATALRLWHEYLIDLQSFLSGSVPADYENLSEHRRLCRVHRNLLTSQRSVLVNENRETKNRELVDRFDTLTNLHNETLARIVERHDEVCARIASWDDYREAHTELLRWLKEMEREKEKLQLRYVHIKRVHNILVKIQNLADKVPEGRKQTDRLLIYLKKVLEFTEDAYGTSVRMEYAGIVKRADNLQASLDTWRDFLTRILGLIGEYEKLTDDLHKQYAKTQDEIGSYSDDDRLSRPQLKKAIDKYTELRTKIIKTETQIETLSVIQEQLKECLSPQDIRLVNQRVWHLRQQRADLEHQLSIIIHRLRERLEIYSMFDTRLIKFTEWLTAAEERLVSADSRDALDPQDLIRRITADVHAETAMKEREFEWLGETGESLVERSKKDEKSYSKNAGKKLKDAQERWYRLKETGKARVAKIDELLRTIEQLEERLTEIRTRLHGVEGRLAAPVVLERLTTAAVDDKVKDRDHIHREVESESGKVGDALNLCELVLGDADVVRVKPDLRNLRTGRDIVERKWRSVCDTVERRKTSLKEVRRAADLAVDLLPKFENKLTAIEKRVERIESRKQRGEPEDEKASRSVLKDLEALEDDAKRLEEAGARIAGARGVELRGEGADTASRVRGSARRRARLVSRVLAAGADAHRQFVAAHGAAVVALAEVDVRLTRALHLSPSWETDASLQVDTLTSKETYRAELVIAVKETSDSLEALRSALLQQPKDDAKSDELANAAKEIAKAGAKPAQTLELAKHLSELLLTECDATEDEAMLKDVESLSLRYEDLLTQAKKRELQINNL
ncbi:Nesprin-1, partial [Operophtera brumata]